MQLDISRPPLASDEVEGRLVILNNPVYPVDWLLREIAKRQPAGALILRQCAVILCPGDPGEGMYTTDGKSSQTINYPVVEAIYTGDPHITELPDGTYLTVLVEENKWKRVADTHVWVILGALWSLWEISIIILGGFRLFQFAESEHGLQWLSIGPLCISMEMIGASLRIVNTLVDPFWSTRILNTNVAYSMLTINVPFTFSSGILLTLFCT